MTALSTIVVALICILVTVLNPGLSYLATTIVVALICILVTVLNPGLSYLATTIFVALILRPGDCAALLCKIGSSFFSHFGAYNVLAEKAAHLKEKVLLFLPIPSRAMPNVRELKAELAARGIELPQGCLDKSDLEELLRADDREKPHEQSSFFSHFGAYNEEILRPLNLIIVSCVRGECTADGVKKEILATLMLQPLDARSGFVLYNVLALLAGVAESSIAMSLGYGWFSFVWNACVGYCVAYSLYWIFLCKQMKVRSTISIVLCADA